MNTETKQQRAERLVQQEVFLCVSSIVHTLATASFENVYDSDLRDGLMTQAAELAAPVLDYEEAAREAGWRIEETTHEGSGNWYAFKIEDGVKKIGSDQFEDQAAVWQDLCDAQDIEPYEREVFEHWAVSDWLAEKLEAKGEKVDRDFAGWNVWARATTGQAISMDGVIESIVADLYKAEG